MDTVLNTVCVYLILLTLVRLTGRRTLAQMTAFDLIVLLIIGGTTQRSLLGQDYSVINALLVVITLLLLDVGFSLLKLRAPALSRVVEGQPMILVESGRPLAGRMRMARIAEADVLAAARRTRGLERLDQIRFAILEPSGEITVIPASAQ
jgi:uncharacterized membrane protein YcaP (DUF421 family)